MFAQVSKRERERNGVGRNAVRMPEREKKVRNTTKERKMLVSLAFLFFFYAPVAGNILLDKQKGNQTVVPIICIIKSAVKKRSK